MKSAKASGQTESVAMLANSRYGTPTPGSLGLPMPIYDVALLDDEGTTRLPKAMSRAKSA